MDMMSLLTDFNETKIDSRYRLVIISAQRARQMMLGSKPQITSKFTKETMMALDEVLQGKAEFLTGEEARAALKEAILTKALETRFRPRIPQRPAGEDDSEIKKDLSIYVNDQKGDEAPADGIKE